MDSRARSSGRWAKYALCAIASTAKEWRPTGPDRNSLSRLQAGRQSPWIGAIETESIGSVVVLSPSQVLWNLSLNQVEISTKMSPEGLYGVLCLEHCDVVMVRPRLTANLEWSFQDQLSSFALLLAP